MWAGEHVATVWQAVSPTGPLPGGADLAALLRAVHAVPAQCRALPDWDPLTDFDNRMRHTTTMADADHDFLLRRSADAVGQAVRFRGLRQVAPAEVVERIEAEDAPAPSGLLQIEDLTCPIPQAG